MRSRAVRLTGALAAVALAAGIVAAPATAGGPGAKFGSVDGFKVGKYRVEAGAFEGILVRGMAPTPESFASIRRGGSSVGYAGEAQIVQPEHIKGTFGRFGKLDIRFHKTGPFKKAKRPRGCDGRPDKIQKGVWKGTFKLKTEESLVDVSRHELDGRITKRGKLNCPIQPINGTSLQGSSADSFFGAFKRARGKAQFFASTGERKRGADINRFVSVRGPRSAFKSAADLSSAKIEPPAPFSGVGRFQAAPPKRGGAATGTIGGNLKVRMLGMSGKLRLRTNDASLYGNGPRPRALGR